VSCNEGAAIGPGPVYALSRGPFARTAVMPFVLASKNPSGPPGVRARLTPVVAW